MMKRQKRRNALRKRLEKLGIIAMILVSSGLMFQLIINVLIMNSNNLVTAYSRELNETNYIEIETKTENEVESQVQSEEYLTIDIEVEKETKSTELSKEYEVDKDDLYLLSHLIMAEEEGASYENKLMCGLVAMNRVKDKSYPNTLEEVIFQKDKKGNVQYACIKSAKGKKARIYLEPNEDSLRAAKEILSKNCSIKIPEEVVFQSERPLGSGVYKKIGNQYYSYK